jgi:gliding motility-associated protein GldC
MGRKSEIKLTVELDDDKMPAAIEWEATDSGFEGSKPAKTMMLSLWDDNEKSTYSIDLWTKEMLLKDMNLHFHQMFMKMADTYQRATNNAEVSDMIKKFAAEFGDKLELFGNENE